MTQEIQKQKPFYGETGIQLYDKELSPQCKIIYSAILNGVKVNSSAINDHKLYDLLTMAISKIHLDLQRALPGDNEFEHMRKEVIKKIRNKKWNLRDTELLIALENGIAGDYGEWYGINAVSICMFLASYVAQSNVDRVEALRQINKPAETLKTIPDENEQFTIAKENALKAYRIFLSDVSVLNDKSVVFGTSGLMGAMIFDFFYNIKLFLITQEEIDDIMERGKELYLRELKIKASTINDVLRRKEIDNRIEAFISMVQREAADEAAKDNEPHPMVVSCAKRIYIDDLFKGFYAEDLGVSELSDQIEKMRPS